MRRFLASLVLATTLVACAADCQPGLEGRQDWYRCEDLTNLQLQIPTGAVGIDIRNSSIATIPSDAFSKYGDTLEELNITGCGVREIQPNAFRGLGKLRVLGLVNNEIRALDASWLQDLPQLSTLDVWRNRISTIDARLYDLLTNLQFWDIAHNDLVDCLSPESLKKLTRLRRIYIAGNPWSYRCRASMTWYLGSNHIRFVQDWGAGDLLIEECLAHEPDAATSDVALANCVQRTTPSANFPNATMIQYLVRKVMELEADVAALKKARDVDLQNSLKAQQM
ncbi:leucine-rich repeat and immunoglobulin-like domain-containing nogo receptor-interacting protein 1 [Harpegnathos saltator]|uniref:Chondroadherin-like protein n=1 Tax=Harpegnathos saltator TaxID=610380 RepID=E2C8W6_HARSA|nr:leucine-rich repeat and immunoglobulin-like domain-containing nogo receptor-interacting protein 1 [Harpegnathos saltator]EFN75616.1 Chondroadherin-like protein [Harpegnathos saltator]